MTSDGPTGHEPDDGLAMAARVDAAISEMPGLGERLSLSSLGRHLSGELADSDPLRGLAVGLQYQLIADTASEDRQLFGPFAPFFEGTLESGEPYRIPQDLGEVGSDVVEVWRLCALEEVHPVVRARLADLLWEVRQGDDPHEWAILAIDSYMAAAGADWENPIEVRDGLFRALELCLLLNQPERNGPVLAALADTAERSLANRAQQPGVVIPALEALAERGDPAAQQLIGEALDVYGNDPWIMESLLEIRARFCSPDECEEIWERQVAGYVEQADLAEGMRKHALLRKAADLAASKGLTATHDEIVTRIEAIDWEEMGFGTAQVETEIDAAAVEEWVSALVGDDDLDLALSRFGSQIPDRRP